MTSEQYNQKIIEEYLNSGWNEVIVTQWGNLNKKATIRSGARKFYNNITEQERQNYVLIYIKSIGGKYGKSVEIRYRKSEG